MKHVMLLIGLVVCINIFSCASVKKKPQPEVKLFTFPLVRNTNGMYSKSDFAKAKLFGTSIGSIKRIAIQYNTTTSGEDNDDTSKKDNSHLLWQGEIEKKLLRKGFIVCEEKSKNEIIDGITIDTEDTKNNHAENTHSASLIIDSAKIYKATKSYLFFLDNNSLIKNTYTYTYYIAEISGKIVLNNNDIIWRSNIIATTFDLMKSKEKNDAAIIIRGLKDYTYSTEKNSWLPGSWQVDSASDNFRDKYNEGNEKFHMRELIEFAINGFIDSL